MHIRTRLSSLALVGASLAALVGCGTTPYSQLSGERWFRVPIDTYPVTIVAVDGVSTPTWTPVQVLPGTREIRVESPSGPAGPWRGVSRQITLDVKPCTRYYLVAVRDNRLSRDFEVRVDHEQPVAGCAAG